jgi:CelD/BcsL family acetyltransferase involved in cellulose biosynthesis
VLGTLAEIDAIADEWRALERHCADPMGYFQSYDWCSTWLRHFAGDHIWPYVITVWAGDQLVALWPRMVVHSAGLKRLETLSAPHAQYCGALIRRGVIAQADLAKEMRAATRAAGCDVTISRAVLDGSALAELLAHKKMIEGEENASSILDLSGFTSVDAYNAQLKTLQKRNRNRRRNHLSRLGALSFEVIWPGHPDFATLVRTGAQMKRRWLSETGRYSVGFSMPGYEEFLIDLAGDPDTARGACLSVLRVGERVVAVELGFLKNGHYYAYIGGFDWELRHLSPGKVQMEMTVAWLIEKGATGYDLLINPAQYKDSWTNRTVSVTALAEAMTWKGRFYTTTWMPMLRPALKRLYRWAPSAFGSAFNWLRPAACLLLYV